MTQLHLIINQEKIQSSINKSLDKKAKSTLNKISNKLVGKEKYEYLYWYIPYCNKDWMNAFIKESK